MSKLGEFSRHCLQVAEKIADSRNYKLSKGFIDIPGFADGQGRSNTLEYPTLSKKDNEQNFRLYFTYNYDTSTDIDGKSFGAINQGYKTPWLRITHYIKDIKKVNFYRIYKREKSFLNTLKKTFFITPGKELNSSASLRNYYYLDCSINKDDIINKIQISDILSKLENFSNLKMIRVDSKELIVDIKCEEKEQYTSGLMLGYIETVDDLMSELLKV